MSYLGSDINTDNYTDINDGKISSLDYTNPMTASYISDRKSVMFNATGTNTYSSTSGSSVVRFQLESPVDWLDPSSVRVQFDIVNDATYVSGTANEQLFLTGGPHSFFSRLRVLSRGIVLHDITEYNRVHELFSYFKSQNVKTNELSESIFLTDHNGSDIQVDLVDTVTSSQITTGIRPGDRITVLFKPFCGILNQEKYLPLKYAPLTFELVLVTAATDPVVTKGAKKYDGTAAGTLTATPYTAALVSNSWHLENFKIRCDLIKLNETLQNSFDDQLLGKNRIKIRFNNHISQVFSVVANGGQDININMTRALSNLDRVFVSFIKTGGVDRFYSKDYNTFYSTSYVYNLPNFVSNDLNIILRKPVYTKTLDPVLSAQLAIGGKLFPEYPLQSSQETFYMLKKSFNDEKVFNHHIHSVDIKGKSYLCDKFVICFDTCKINAGTAAYTGLDVRNGANINLRYKFPPLTVNGVSTGVVLPDMVHTILEAESDFLIMGTFVYVAE